MKAAVALVWFRNDLRLHDHEAFSRAVRAAQTVVPVFCIDPRWFRKTAFGFPKLGAFRAKFLIESLVDLRQRLRAHGCDLLIAHGKPEEILPDLARRTGAGCVYMHREVTAEETAVEAAVERALLPLGVPMERFWGSTLFHIDDLSTPVAAMPEVFTAFRKQTEKLTRVRPTLPEPAGIWPIPDTIGDLGALPTLADWGLAQPPADERAVLPFTGGETAALQRLNAWIWQGDHLKTYKETRNGLIGADYSSKFSPYLAFGCLSPRLVYETVRTYEQQRVANDSTYWLIFELIWRDFFRFIVRKHGNSVFRLSGMRGAPTFAGGGGKKVSQYVDWKAFTAWAEGRTGDSFVDANMRELRQTGFMSNRGRQNVASYLVHDLHLDWRMGAEWFESLLIDYDPCSNYGNWNYVAGVGNDPREDRYFNTRKQAAMYDPKEEYQKLWNNI